MVTHIFYPTTSFGMKMKICSIKTYSTGNPDAIPDPRFSRLAKLAKFVTPSRIPPWPTPPLNKLPSPPPPAPWPKPPAPWPKPPAPWPKPPKFPAPKSFSCLLWRTSRCISRETTRWLILSSTARQNSWMRSETLEVSASSTRSEGPSSGTAELVTNKNTTRRMKTRINRRIVTTKPGRI